LTTSLALAAVAFAAAAIPAAAVVASVGGASGATAAAPKAPVATAVVLARSLKAPKPGVLFSYSVRPQGAGHAEVLLSRAMAKRLRITAPAASSLGAGYAPRVVVAKAFIRTIKGGRSKLTLQFSSKTAKRLARDHNLSLMLRMFVRNAANQS